MLPSLNENSERESNPMPWLVYLYLSGSAFLVSFTDPKAQLFNVKSMFKFLNHGVSLQEIFTYFFFRDKKVIY